MSTNEHFTMCFMDSQAVHISGPVTALVSGPEVQGEQPDAQTYNKTGFTGHFNSMNGPRERERKEEKERERTPGAHLSSVICLWQVESGWI